MLPNSNNLVFFLGGRDLEIVTIRELLEQYAPGRFCDKGLAWGARASEYRAEIEGALARGARPVLIELMLDLSLPEDKVIVIDHHGQRAGSRHPTSLHQVFAMLKLPKAKWTRWHELVAANDRGYIPALLASGATQAEIREIREADRKAQGVTAEEEAAAEEALTTLQVLADGDLTVAVLPHAHTSPLCDRLEPALGGRGFRNLLISSPRQLNFYGTGESVYALNEKFPDGWYGGALPERGFWGHDTVSFSLAQEFLLDYLASKRHTS